MSTHAGQTTAHVKYEPGFWAYASMEAEDYDAMYYVKGTIVFVAFYFFLHLLVHILCVSCSSVYRERDTIKRIDYRSYVISILHSPIAVFLSFSGMFLVCPNDSTVFNDDACYNTPRYIHIWSLLNTVGYFGQDLFYLFFYTGDSSPLTYQTYAHHIVAIFTFYETAFFMNWMMIFGCMLLFIEVSTVFVSARTLLFYHGMQTSWVYNVNGVLALIMFFLSRIVYQIGITLVMGLPYYIHDVTKDKAEAYEIFVLTQLATLVIGSIVLNLHWFMLMAAMARRALARMTGGEKGVEMIQLVDDKQAKSDQNLMQDGNV